VILRKRDLKKAKLVQRGEQLILSAASTSYSIETTAVALQDGYYGDQIKLRNIDSNQELRAVVSGINRAKALH
jgi:flagella basal body P-ring formation protein FlgA